VKGTYTSKTAEYRKSYQQKKRLEVLQHYSESQVPFCACCQEKNVEFLVVNHIDGAGSAYRKENKPGGYSHYTRIIQAGFPQKYRVLCHNCNQAIGFYGYCPHQQQ